MYTVSEFVDAKIYLIVISNIREKNHMRLHKRTWYIMLFSCEMGELYF